MTLRHYHCLGLRFDLRPLFLLWAAWSAAVPAAVPSPPDEEGLRLDQAVQGLKHESLLLASELRTLEEQTAFPLRSRTGLYVAVNVSGFLLQEAIVRVDGGEAVSYRYPESEQRALLKGGYHRIAQLSLAPGVHQLRVEFSGRFFDAPRDAEPLRGVLETAFEKDLSELDLVLPIARNSRLDRPGLPEVARLESQRKRGVRAVWLPEPEELPSGAGHYLPGSEQDPRVRYARFLEADGRYFSALLELHHVLLQTREPAQLPESFWWLLSDCTLAFGLEQQAEQMYRRFSLMDMDPERLARARLRLADFQYERGYYAAATASLRRVRELLPPALLPEWQDRITELLLGQGRYNEAIEILSLAAERSGLPLHQRYNLGIALINDGKLAQGRHVLDEVGRSTPVDQETLAIRDKANLTLGYHFLQSQQGGTAKPFFERVRVNGPFSNRALLGLGWAEVSPRGTRQERALLDETKNPPPGLNSLGALLRPGYIDADPARRLARRAFRRSRLAQDVEDQLQRALVPWLELAQRDPMDPAVQEGMLAIPYALERLGDYEQAIARYDVAIKALEAFRTRLDAAERAIAQGRMVETIVRRDPDAESGWHWKLRDLPDTPETYYLQSLLAEHRFQEALKNYRDLRLLARHLEGARARLQGLVGDYVAAERPAVEAEEAVASARHGWEPPWADLPIRLRLEQELAPPGSSEIPFALPNPWTVELQALLPAHPTGVLEQGGSLQRRMDQLRPVLSEAAVQQGRYLQKLAVRELEGQKHTIDRYLVEARFALARLYDRSMKEAARRQAPAIEEAPDAAP